MGVRFNGSNSYLSKASALVTASPASVCFWARAYGDLNATLFALTGAANHYIAINNNQGANSLCVEADDNGGSGASSAGVSLTDNDRWCFCVMRWISTARKNVAMWSSAGLSGSNGINSNISPTLTGTILGGTSGLNLGFQDGYFDGTIAEYYMLDSDIGSMNTGSSSTDAAYLKELALQGVWSMPHLRASVVEYQSFLSDPCGMNPKESYFRQTPVPWINNNGVVVDEHPPLPGSYKRPNDFTRNLII